MNPFDFIIIIIFAYGLIRGIFRGLVREISSIIGVLGGFYAAYTYYPKLSDLISPWISNSSYRNIISCMAIFSIVVIVIAVLAVVIKYLLNIAYLGWVDRICGALFGAFKGVLVICVIFIVLTTFLPKGAPLLQNATLSPHVAKVSQSISNVLSKDMKAKFRSKIKEFQKVWQTP